jgi:hypothetical protein
MSMLAPTLLLYLLVGLAMAVGVYLARGAGANVLLAIVFWPFYVPLLVTRPSSGAPQPLPLRVDEMSAAITQVDAELTAALASLQTWPAEARQREAERLAELRSGWIAQAERIRAMDRLLALPDYAGASPAAPSDAAVHITERVRHSQEARQDNVDRLRQVRHKAYDDLMATLAWVRELVSMIHLARFTGAPNTRVTELLDQIVNAQRRASEPAITSLQKRPGA